MANWAQRVIYHLSNAVPLAVMTALAWYLKYKTWIIPFILFGVAACISIIFALCFTYGKNNCSIKQINATKIITKDSWIIAYILAYLLPFANLVISDYNIVSLMVVVLMLLLVIIPAIFALPNILLFICGYHFYELETETGIGDYLVISKRKRIRNKSEIKNVMRVFEKLMVDTKGSD